ncbi:MAG: ATP:cob(I)alamin adenosyltransferase [Thermobacillus sp. ZCTH02-B1]|uniref:cob(I)yrinic acid a,c-diamide adenosyltransferase n=1 Tax=Thermobacillus sp. ZCTH02-B1 TaxID=1858795 RepID=UPI000B555F88|nr:cob(I)yrinic acid a,c-diamide adenosyltransferase [Thermobacillus sp. ZCTH02-B1]OUM95405.1 MAG: ATP:cob(I)alamin adenosyltransferase [Thermobacillus sp. ZCTH02-B1]
MKWYTRKGDSGRTGIIGGRVRKDDVRVEAYGTIDELNSFIGLAAAALRRADGLGDMADELAEIQQELFDCGSDLAYAENPEFFKMGEEPVERLERRIDELDREAPPVARFILPGGSEPAALLHVCRTVCRRAERRVVALAAVHPVNEAVLRYLNRLSDWFFVAARAANARLGVADAEYARGAVVFRGTNHEHPRK